MYERPTYNATRKKVDGRVHIYDRRKNLHDGVQSIFAYQGRDAEERARAKVEQYNAWLADDDQARIDADVQRIINRRYYLFDLNLLRRKLLSERKYIFMLTLPRGEKVNIADPHALDGMAGLFDQQIAILDAAITALIAQFDGDEMDEFFRYDALEETEEED
jgi:hypothetical protein